MQGQLARLGQQVRGEAANAGEPPLLASRGALQASLVLSRRSMAVGEVEGDLPPIIPVLGDFLRRFRYRSNMPETGTYAVIDHYLPSHHGLDVLVVPSGLSPMQFYDCGSPCQGYFILSIVAKYSRRQFPHRLQEYVCESLPQA